MKKHLITLIGILSILLLASGLYAQTIGNGALVQYSSNLGFYGMVYGSGPKPIAGIALMKNGQVVTGVETLQKIIVDPSINEMYFVVRKTDVPQFIKPGDMITIIITDSLGVTAQKTVTILKGPGPILIGLAQF